MTPAPEDFSIALETSTASTRTVITLRSDGTAEHRDNSRVDRTQRVDAKEVQALLQALLDANFFEQRNVLDRGLTRHEEWYRLTLRYQGREHSVHFDGNRFAAELQDLASTVRTIAYRDFWEPKLPPESR